MQKKEHFTFSFCFYNNYIKLLLKMQKRNVLLLAWILLQSHHCHKTWSCDTTSETSSLRWSVTTCGGFLPTQRGRSQNHIHVPFYVFMHVCYCLSYSSLSHAELEPCLKFKRVCLLSWKMCSISTAVHLYESWHGFGSFILFLLAFSWNVYINIVFTHGPPHIPHPTPQPICKKREE